MMIKTDSIPTVKLLHGLIQQNRIEEFKNLPELWVFGYGSLVWLPKFDFSEKTVGHVSGFSRRFYQGNSTHRGIPGRPGRVATLLRSEKNEEKTYGTAFRLHGKIEIEQAMEHLNMRESTLGGYILDVSIFHSIDGTEIPVVFYVATADNEQYTGVESLTQLAEIIASSTGPSGTNREYLFKLADWQRKNLPDVNDEHLYGLEKLTKRVIQNTEMPKPLKIKQNRRNSANFKDFSRLRL
jgi:cation transport protein ChaC